MAHGTGLSKLWFRQPIANRLMKQSLKALRFAFSSIFAAEAIWTLSQLDDVTAAFQLVDSAAWKIPPLSLSPLLSRCGARGPSSKELRVLSFLAHDEFKPLTEEVVASRLRVAREAQPEVE